MLMHIDFCRYQYELLKIICSFSDQLKDQYDTKTVEELIWWNIHRHFGAVESLSF